MVSGLEDLVENPLADPFNHEERCFFVVRCFSGVRAGASGRILEKKY
jgi:hypothetical protein